MSVPTRSAAVALGLLASVSASAEVEGRVVEYRDGETVLEGYLAYDTKGPAKRPGVLVVHDWTGVGPYVRRRADELAAMGYVAFAADVYGKGVRPANPKEASATASVYRNDRRLFRSRVRAALAELRKQPNVLPGSIAAIGFCFGGTAVIELARSGADVLGVVSFHGGLDSPTPSDGKNIRARVLVLHGADDPFVPEDKVRAFEEEMRQGGVDWQLVKYGGAVHSFTIPDAGSDNSKGAAYNAAADRRSWKAMQDFFAEIFAGAAPGAPR
ncbi:MAG TPA: dienelactone hydrolase family protein [Anaeromyxobacteraceae bacterium]|nr:dienelactone hydrolase family protein [Anaeromyxobacteraceae bacterium]